MGIGPQIKVEGNSPLLLPPPLALEVSPLNPARDLGSAMSSPSRVWDGAPA